jgi:hypothetical protein
VKPPSGRPALAILVAATAQVWGALFFLAWSRLALRRHRRAEVALGTLIGAAAGGAICGF